MNKLNFALSNIYLLFITFYHLEIARMQCKYMISHCNDDVQASNNKTDIRWVKSVYKDETMLFSFITRLVNMLKRRSSWNFHQKNNEPHRDESNVKTFFGKCVQMSWSFSISANKRATRDKFFNLMSLIIV